MNIYDKLISDSQSWDIQYERTDGPGFSLKMKNQWHPFSIKLAEFEYIKDFIIRHNLKIGYEVATAFGISALAAALGFKETGGKLVTMDAYIEEKYGECGAYAHKGKEVYDISSKGWKSVNNLIAHFGIEKNLIPTIGWSPDDTKKVLYENLNLDKDKIQYAFIDGLHTEPQVILDTKSIKDYIDRDRFAIFYHDQFLDKNAYPRLYQYLIEEFGIEPRLIPECAMPHGYDLGILTNLE